MSNKYNVKNNEKIEVKDFSAQLEIKPNRQACFIISSEVVDDEGEIILVDGCDMSDVQSGARDISWLDHDYKKEASKIVSVTRIGKSIIAEVVYPERPADLPMCEQWIPDLAYAKAKAGLSKASVDFVSSERRNPTKKDVEQFGDKLNLVHAKTKLLGFSQVSMPANKMAQMLACKALKNNLITKEELGMIGIKEEDLPKDEVKEEPVVEVKPLPERTDGQTEEEFMSYCMLALNDEYPDEAQRAAICNAQWAKDLVEDTPEEIVKEADPECPEDKPEEVKEGYEDEPKDEYKSLLEKAKEILQTIHQSKTNYIKRVVSPDLAKDQINSAVKKRMAQLKGQIWIE